MRGLSLVAASGGHSSSRCAGLSLSRPLLLRSTGSRCAGSVIVAHGPSCFAACGILPYQGSNPCPLHWQADSQPLRHQESPTSALLLSLSLPTFETTWEINQSRRSFQRLLIQSAEVIRQRGGPVSQRGKSEGSIASAIPGVRKHFP